MAKDKRSIGNNGYMGNINKSSSAQNVYVHISLFNLKATINYGSRKITGEIICKMRAINTQQQFLNEIRKQKLQCFEVHIPLLNIKMTIILLKTMTAGIKKKQKYM